jgi:hypothetical protein
MFCHREVNATFAVHSVDRRETSLKREGEREKALLVEKKAAPFGDTRVISNFRSETRQGWAGGRPPPPRPGAVGASAPHRERVEMAGKEETTTRSCSLRSSSFELEGGF